MQNKNKVMITMGIVVFLLIYFLLFFQKGITIYDTFLKKSQEGSQIKYSGTMDGYSTTILVEKTNENLGTIRFSQEDIVKNYAIQITPKSNQSLQDITIREGNKVMFDGQYDPQQTDVSFSLFEKNGELQMEEIEISFVGQQERHEELSIYQIMQFFEEEDEFRGNFAWMLVAFLIMILWTIDICFPRFFFLSKHFLAVENPEPSELYIALQQISWRVIPVIAIISLIISLLY